MRRLRAETVFAPPTSRLDTPDADRARPSEVTAAAWLVLAAYLLWGALLLEVWTGTDHGPVVAFCAAELLVSVAAARALLRGSRRGQALLLVSFFTNPAVALNIFWLGRGFLYFNWPALLFQLSFVAHLLAVLLVCTAESRRWFREMREHEGLVSGDPPGSLA